MKYLMTAAVLMVTVLAAAEAPAEGPQTCNKTCDARYEQCFRDAVEYGYDAATARVGCQEKRKICKDRCK